MYYYTIYGYDTTPAWGIEFGNFFKYFENNIQVIFW